LIYSKTELIEEFNFYLSISHECLKSKRLWLWHHHLTGSNFVLAFAFKHPRLSAVIF
jgi:hypothetical protein